MFSELPTRPRQQYLRRLSAPLPALRFFRDEQAVKTPQRALPQRPVDVVGVDRFKFFHCPKVEVGAQFGMSNVKLFRPPPIEIEKDKPTQTRKNQKIQTQYRDSEAQTMPWQPSFTVTDGSDPEMLKLDFLKWGTGLGIF